MAEHQVDTAELTALAQSLAEFAAHVALFESRSMSHGNALLASWQGAASREFYGELATWAIGAKALQARADNLATWANQASSVYEGAVEQAKGVAGA